MTQLYSLEAPSSRPFPLARQLVRPPLPLLRALRQATATVMRCEWAQPYLRHAGPQDLGQLRLELPTAAPRRRGSPWTRLQPECPSSWLGTTQRASPFWPVSDRWEGVSVKRLLCSADVMRGAPLLNRHDRSPWSWYCFRRRCCTSLERCASYACHTDMECLWV